MRGMIGRENFFSQLHSYSDPRLGRLTCGVTSFAMVLKQLGILQKLPGYQAGSRLDWFLKYYASRHVQDRPVLIRSYGGIEVVVDPTGDLSEVIDGEYVRPAGRYYSPTFSIKRGFDHRGAVELLRETGTWASVEENISTTQLKILMEEDVDYFLASTHYTSKSGGISSHIVVVYKVSDTEVSYVDPLEETYDKAKKVTSTETFEKMFRGYGTAIWRGG